MPYPKKANRTKGNVKPSSSSQAALLLAASGQAPAGFLGFATQPAFVPASDTFDDADSVIDDDFRLVLRKLSKRDSVTKVKALQDFITLCNSKDEECIKVVIPFWPRVYIKITIDVDHKVREFSQKALATLAARAGKALAPHLKSIMGSWMVSMCDTYPTVASAANTAFTSTFSVVKQTEAIRFCKAEIAECLMNYILQQTSRTLSDPLTTNEEDMEAKYQRVVSSSLQAFSKLLHMLPADSVSDSMLLYLTKLLDNSVFWKHAKSTVPQVQCGVLSILSATCQLCPLASGKVINKIAPWTFSCLDSTDPNVVSHTWDAVLSLISSHEDCWQHVNWQKAVWPKIKHVLESACSGQAVVVCPCLLPLLSKIPKINFTHFFDSFRLGLREDSILNSPLDLSALVRSFLECVQFAVKKISDNGEDTSLEIRSLIIDQVLLIVQASLTDSKPGLSKTELYSRLCPLLFTVTKIDAGIESSFWSELSSFVRERLSSEFISAENHFQESFENNNEPVIFQRLKLLFEGIIFQQTASSAKTGRVQFVSEGEQVHQKKLHFFKEKQIISDSAERFLSDMFVTVFKLSSFKESSAPLFFRLFKDLSLVHIPNKAAERLISQDDPVANLVVTELGRTSTVELDKFHVVDFRKSVQSKLSASESEAVSKFRDFLCDYLVKLLLYAQGKEDVNSQMRGQFTGDVVMSVFAFVAYVDSEDGASILFEVLNSLTDPRITCQFIEHLLGNVKYIAACKPLVVGTELAGKIERLTTLVTGGERDGEKDVSGEVWKMLTSVVSSLDESDSHLFSQSCLDAVLTSCLATLQMPDLSHRVETVSCVVDLILALFDKHKISTHVKLGELVLSLLPLLLDAQLAELVTLTCLKSSWLAGLRIILQKKSDVEIQQFVCQFCALVKRWIQSNVHIHESLTNIAKVIRASLLTIAWPLREELEDEGQLSGSDDCQVRDDDDDFDQETVSAALGNLLMTDCAELSCLKEVYEYLYVDGSLESLPQYVQSEAARHLSLQMYLVKTLHNLNVLLLNMELLFGKKQLKEAQQMCDQWSEAQLETMVETSHSLIVLQAANKIKQQDFKECTAALLTRIQDDLVNVVRSLNPEQLTLFADFVAQRPDGTYSAFKFGIKSVLELVFRSQLEDMRPVSPAIKSALLSVRISFLARCLPSDNLVSGVAELLAKSNVSGHSIREAFTLACTGILSCEDMSLRGLADCISGFLILAKDCDVLLEEVKLSMFQQITAVVKQLKEGNVHLLSGSDKVITTVDHIQFNVCIIRAVRIFVVPSSDQYWEFTLCALVEWIQFLSKTKLSQTSDAGTKALFTSACELAYLAAHTFSTAPVATETIPDFSSPFVTEKAKTEWNEFFSEGVFSLLLPMFVSQASSAPQPDEPLWTLLVQALASVVSLCPGQLVLAHQLPVRLTVTDKSGTPDNLKTLFNHLCPLLMSRLRCVEVAAYRLLSSVIEEIPKHEGNPEDEEKQEEELRSPPEALVQHVEAAGHFLECLKVVHVEDHIEMDKGTSEHALAMGYLLSWRLLLQLFGCSPNQLRAKYAQYFKANGLVSRLLDHLFRLIPHHPSPTMLEFMSELQVQGRQSESELSTLALYVYRGCLETLPALVRAWWVDQDRKSSNFVDKFTTQYLSNSLICQQITSAQNTINTIDGILIRARPAAREVYATCEMAEVTVNMTITLPENYPLGKLEVACDKRVGVSQAQWDRWLLQLNIFLQHQNGTIVEGLRLWKGNIDKKFEGIEDCTVCFCVIHGTTFQLPRLTCKTCRKKFHSACLYKWFTTAQKSTCPLCRNVF